MDYQVCLKDKRNIVLFYITQYIILYIDGISQRSVSDGIIGSTFACIIANQFNDLCYGDRYCYET